MIIMNAADGPRGILSLKLKLKPGEVATVDDAAWKKLRKKPNIAAWLDRGELKEVTASEANKAKEAKDKGGDGKPDTPKK
ncbi:hypothetical protein [Hyphomicrobium sp. CS1GBMeth3]|uniref:hypothetical protein n=1 Tax=Hyphomicrobium sp. CS1GBMeth3 TaxID=1892845 RepID=UPI0009313191|nr:hypothetical protein [Hyphomicrobium sp. CS1GBMeth3]